MSALPFNAILKATLESTIEVVLICAGGYLLASSGILDKPAQKSLSNANLYFFTPCLIFVKLASQLRWNLVKILWAIPILVAILIAVGYVVAVIGSRILRLDRQWEKFVIACTIFQNTNAPPIAIIMSLPQTLSAVLYCPLIKNDNPDKVVSRGILYLLIISQITLVIRWSYGYRVLLAPDPQEDPSKPIITERTPLNASQNQNNLSPYDLDSDYMSTSHSMRSTSTFGAIQDRRRSLDRRSLHSLSRESLTSFPALSVRSSDHQPQGPLSNFKSALRQIAALMNPPLWAVLASVIVALISPLQHELFFNKTSFLHNSLFVALDSAGAVAIPLILVSLGSSLVKSRDVLDLPSPPETDLHLKMEKRGIFLSLFARMAMVPLLLIPLLLPIMSYGIKNEIGILSDPIFWVVVFLIIGTPASLQLTQITQIHGLWDRELAKVLWWGYAVFCIPSTIIAVIISLELLKWSRG